jgi:hypothetical protein
MSSATVWRAFRPRCRALGLRHFLEALGEAFEGGDRFIGPLPIGRVQGFELLSIGLQRRVVRLDGCDRLGGLGALLPCPRFSSASCGARRVAAM